MNEKDTFDTKNARDRSSPTEFHGSDEAPHKAPSMQTPYMVMSIKANQARQRYNICAGFFAWLTLAGYVVFPNTFTSLQSSDSLKESKEGQIIQETVRNVQLLPLAGLSCLIGIAGTFWLWWRWRRNYVWLITRIFLLGLSHSLISLLTTVVSVLTTQDRHFSVTAKITITIITVWGGTMLTLAIVYDRILHKIMTPHDKEVVENGEP
ncbi:hypothetical protein K469DRAFT_581419 [Zopfia rhizophila CBS 207.26]|uniref:Uncharacterized protein n=1 Tax=Zopfia rhizophila CBS 207.26 TaxID=1314779 RepID=A0A6A6E011_9PEZI|nr:hypothetical protein K469DRAFT_581419 [Zopfia rhizophila CBS 207.26]